jgi:hypothetical protein
MAAFDWSKKGFAAPPERKVAPPGGLTIYRAWGTPSSDVGSGWFSLEKPRSVLDAELKFNVLLESPNALHFVSTFRLKEGFPYYVGPVAHGEQDQSRPATQIYLEPPFETHLERVGTKEVLTPDVTRGRAGTA